MNQQATAVTVVHGVSSQGWAISIAQRMAGHGIHALPVEANVLESSALARAVVAVCIDATTDAEWLRSVLGQTRLAEHSPRVFPLLLAGASDPLVAEMWPQWDWIDFRQMTSHATAFTDLLRAVAGEPTRAVGTVGGTGPGSALLNDYRRKFHVLAHLKGVGLEEEIYLEAHRKLVIECWDDPRWEDQ